MIDTPRMRHTGALETFGLNGPVRALVVDDDPAWSEMIAEALRRAGLEVTTVESAAGAAERARRESYQLALVDYVLSGSGTSGLEVAEVIRTRNPDAVIIILTAWPDRPLSRNAYRVKIDDLVRKSEISTEILLRRVSQALSRQKLHGEPLSVAYLETVANDSLSIIAHELRTPVVSIMRQAELMCSGAVGELSDGQREAAGLIRSEARRLLTLITGHLRLNDPRSPENLLEINTSDLIGLLADEFSSSSIIANEKHLAINVRSEMEPCTIRVDVELLQIALNPIIENAIRFSPEDAAIDVAVKLEAGYVRVEVADAGPGMAADDVGWLLNPIRESSALPSVRARGGGLGLLISQRAAELHGGRLEVDKTFTRGLRMILLLREYQAIAAS